MRIKSLELIDNPKIKNLKLDFTIENDIQDTIIFAGNNGCGKTTILEEIYLLTNPSSIYEKQREKGEIKSIIELNDDEINIIKNNIINYTRKGISENNCLALLEKTKEFEYTIDFSGERGSYGQYKVFAIVDNNKIKVDSYSILHIGKLEEIMSSFYSTANINYNLNAINSITTIDLDADRNNIRTENNIGTDVKQTFVDIHYIYFIIV